MKKSRSRTVRILKSIFKIRQWVDWERMKGFTRYLVVGFKRFFIPQPAARAESFKVAKARFNLSEAELLARQKGLLRLSILMILMAIGLLAYCIYHLFLTNFLASFLSFVVMLIALVLAFRYHFWYFQIKEQKLGCTIQEWFREGVMGEKS